MSELIPPRVVAGSLSWLLILLVVPGVQAQEVSYHRELTFVREGADPQPGLFLFQMTPQSLAERVLLVTPGGARAISTVRTSAPSATSVMRLTDDETGEWVEIVKHLGVTASGVRALLDVAMETYFEEPHMKIRVAVRTSSGVEEDCEISAAEFGGEAELSRCLIDAQVARQVAQSLPAPILRSLSFLTSALSDYSGVSHAHTQAPRLLVALSGEDSIGRRQVAPEVRDWEQQVGEPVKGLSFEDGPSAELIRSFRQVSAADPFR